MRASLAVLSLLYLTLGAGRAQAHADLVKASPSASATVSAAQEVMLSFTDRLERAFAILTVTDASGIEVSQGKPQVSGNTMRVGLKPLSAGIYKVNWRAISTDTHRSEGSYTFRVDTQ
jgi:methionine-rich copper-binding protein CopC